jgi:hypothetical protein
MKEFLNHTNFYLAESISELKPREKNAVKVVLIGLCRTLETQREQTPIKIISTHENKFDFNGFGNVMKEMGIDIESSMKQENNEGPSIVITFQPKPKEGSRYPIRDLIASRPAVDQFIKSFIDYEPPQPESKPQK